MGLYFRRSVNFGPLRVNFSTRGVGYSVVIGRVAGTYGQGE